MQYTIAAGSRQAKQPMQQQHNDAEMRNKIYTRGVEGNQNCYAEMAKK